MRKLFTLIILLLLVPVLASATYIEVDTLSIPYTTAANYDTLVVSGAVYTTGSEPIIINKIGCILMGDGGGDDTLYLDEDGETGVRLKWGNRNCVIRDLCISITNPVDTGASGVTGSQSGGNQLYVDDGNNLIIENCQFINGGFNNRNIYSAGGTHNVVFRGCKFISNMWGFSDRCLYTGCPIMLQGTLPDLDSGYHWEMVSCTLLNSPHVGVRMSGVARIESCYVAPDARNFYYGTDDGDFCHVEVDPFAIVLRGMRGTSTCANNTIRSGTTYGGSQGIFMERCTVYYPDSTKVYNNDVLVHNGWNWYEYANYGWTFGGFSRSAARNLHVYDNVFRIKVDTIGNDGHQVQYGRAIGTRGSGLKMEVGAVWISCRVGDPFDSCTILGLSDSDSILYSGDSVFVSNNIIEVLSESEGADGRAFEYASGEDDYIEVWNNTIIGGSRIIQGGTDNGRGCNAFIHDNTLGWDTTGYGSHEYTYALDRGNRNNIGNIARDQIYGDGVVDTSFFHYNSGGYENEISLQSTYKVYARGNNDSAVVGANVHVEDSYGNTWSGVTGSNGLKEQVVTYWYEVYLGSDSTAFNPFTVTAWLDSDSAGTVQSFDTTIRWSEASKTDTFDFDVAGTGSWDAEEVANLVSLSVDSLQNDAPGEFDTIAIMYTTSAQTFDSNGYVVLAWSTSSFPSSISDSDLVVAYSANTTDTVYIVVEGTENYTIYVSAWVIGAVPEDQSGRSIDSELFTAADLATLDLVSLSVDSLFNNHTLDLDSFQISFSTDTQTLSDNPTVIIAWSTTSSPDALSDTASGGTSVVYVADSSWVLDLGNIDQTEPYTLYVTAWVYDETNGLSNPTSAYVDFAGATIERVPLIMRSGRYTGGIRVEGD